MSRFGAVAKALRARGFIPLPRLWVKPEDMPQIRKIASKYSDDVAEVRSLYRNKKEEEP